MSDVGHHSVIHPLFSEIVPQDDGLVVFSVFRAEEKRDLAFFCGGAEGGKGLFPVPQLGAISLPELVPLFGIMSEPFPKLGARRDVLQPDVDPGLFFCKAARPEPVDEDPRAVAPLRGFVNALERYHILMISRHEERGTDEDQNDRSDLDPDGLSRNILFEDVGKPK